jgi:hypothetical protein
MLIPPSRSCPTGTLSHTGQCSAIQCSAVQLLYPVPCTVQYVLYISSLLRRKREKEIEIKEDVGAEDFFLLRLLERYPPPLLLTLTLILFHSLSLSPSRDLYGVQDVTSICRGDTFTAHYNIPPCSFQTTSTTVQIYYNNVHLARLNSLSTRPPSLPPFFPHRYPQVLWVGGCHAVSQIPQSPQCTEIRKYKKVNQFKAEYYLKCDVCESLNEKKENCLL